MFKEVKKTYEDMDRYCKPEDSGGPSRRMEEDVGSLLSSVCPLGGKCQRRVVTAVLGCTEFSKEEFSLIQECVARALDVGSSRNKSPSVDTKVVRKLRKASGSMRAKKPADGSSSGNNNFDVDLL